MWVEIIITNIQKTSNACLSSFGRCIKWLNEWYTIYGKRFWIKTLPTQPPFSKSPPFHLNIGSPFPIPCLHPPSPPLRLVGGFRVDAIMPHKNLWFIKIYYFWILCLRQAKTQHLKMLSDLRVKYWHMHRIILEDVEGLKRKN